MRGGGSQSSTINGISFRRLPTGSAVPAKIPSKSDHSLATQRGVKITSTERLRPTARSILTMLGTPATKSR